METENALRALEDPIVRLVFSIAARKAYLVGGFIRDQILGRQSHDRDFVIQEDIEELTNKINELIKGTKVLLKGLTRIVCPDKINTIDLSICEGDIETDLLSRDFTFNAMGISWEGEFFDPMDGRGDLKKRIIRMVQRKNLLQDPLRILRAYRFVSELNFRVERETRQWIRATKDALREVKPERITLEFFKLLRGKEAPRAIKEALEDGVLTMLFSFKSRGLSKMVQEITRVSQRLKVSPDEEFVLQGLTYRGLILLEIMERYAEGSVLQYSRRLRKRIEDFKRAEVSGCLGTEKGLFDCFSSYGESLYEALLINDRPDLVERADWFFTCLRSPLIRGEDIIQEGIKGPGVGRLKRELLKQQFYRRVKDREEALRYLKALIRR